MEDFEDLEDQLDPSRVKVHAPPKNDNIDFSVYSDLENYIHVGFLTTSAIIQNTHFVFKTLNAAEIDLINLSRPSRPTDISQAEYFRANLIAHSILFVNGLNSILSRNESMPKLVKTIRKMSSEIQDHIVGNLGILNRRANRTSILLEAYVHEDRSRYKWLQVSSMKLNDSSITGIPGSENIPLNNAQLAWVAYNKIFDKRDAFEANWQNAKFIGGCFVGKGMRTIEDRDRHRKSTEKNQINEKKLELIKKYSEEINSEHIPKEEVMLPDGRKAEVVSRHKAESAAELADQLTKALNNEKDAHDLAIERHIEMMRKRAQESEQEKSAIIEHIDPLDGPFGYKSVTESEALSRMQKMREAILKNRIALKKSEG